MLLLKYPLNGETVSLLTEKQKIYLDADRSEMQVEDFDYLNLKKHWKEDESFPESVKLCWEPAVSAEAQISLTPDFSEYVSAVGEGSTEVFNLYAGRTYYWRVVSDPEVSDVGSFLTEDRYPRFIKLEGITNVRDCGGWETNSGKRVKQGLLYRGSEMNSHIDITPAGLEVMRNQLKIKTVLDLRTPPNEKVMDVYGGNYANIPSAGYSNWHDAPERQRGMFELLSDKNSYPLYFHCWGGADRTGSWAYILGLILGVKHEQLIDDYEITSLSIWGARSRNSPLFCSFIDALAQFEGESEYEKAVNSLLMCGVTMEQINSFREIMLEN